MPLFTPPVSRRTPPYEQTTRGIQKNLFRHFAGDDQADTIWIYTDGTVSTENPQTTYLPDGTIDEEALSRVELMILGGTTVDITDAQALLLFEAGYDTVPPPPNVGFGEGGFGEGGFGL